MERKINFIFFDLNLREPFINYEFISFMLEKKATHLKFSKEEYIFINKIFKNKFTIDNLFKININLHYIALTDGRNGSKIFLKNNFSLKYKNNSNFKVVNDVGSGDIFSANLIYGIVSNLIIFS